MNDAGRIGFVIKGDYSNTETYDFLDIAYFNGATYVAKKLTVGNTPDNTEFWHILVDGNIDVNDIAPTFLQAETRENINSGEKLHVLFGKIKKFFADLKTVAFTGSYNDLSNKPSASDVGAMPDIIAISEYPYNGITDVLKLPIGRYRFTSQTVWNKFANTPSTIIGIIEVSSIQTGNPDPWTQAWQYKYLLYKSMYSGVMYVRTATSGEVGNIGDSGWLKVTTSKDILDTAELISANTVGGNVAGALGVKQIKNTLNSSINTLNTNLQNTICSNGGTTEEKAKWLIENKKIPTNKPFLIREAHSSINILVGHIYDSYNYGGFLVITTGEVYYAKVSNGTLASLKRIPLSASDLGLGDIMTGFSNRTTGLWGAGGTELDNLNSGITVLSTSPKSEYADCDSWYYKTFYENGDNGKNYGIQIAIPRMKYTTIFFRQKNKGSWGDWIEK